MCTSLAPTARRLIVCSIIAPVASLQARHFVEIMFCSILRDLFACMCSDLSSAKPAPKLSGFGATLVGYAWIHAMSACEQVATSRFMCGSPEATISQIV